MSVNSRDNYTGSRYAFASRRRAEDTCSSCTESVKPDTLVLADGITKYDIVGLDDVKVEELVNHELTGLLFHKLAIADSGVGPEGVPKEFQVRRK
ncbi:hypothetical protein QBC36DRAFT_199582 [Triangularia setosa]|uniref:Uncharacterized protein n=1 Tax=Triangularia setosa TaxID=2587417 RepID=A0AAN7A2U8_9PEZI|nr:hypothetical protein QBC36DRAFT_199582 [Podospora setosa]